MPPPEGFAYRVRKDGSVAITHLGAEAALLRGAAAANFLAKAEGHLQAAGYTLEWGSDNYTISKTEGAQQK